MLCIIYVIMIPIQKLPSTLIEEFYNTETSSLSSALRSLAGAAGSVVSYVSQSKLLSVKRDAERLHEFGKGIESAVQNAVSLKDRAMGVWHMIKPFQPRISAASIMGKAGWKNLNCQKSKKRIDHLSTIIHLRKGCIETLKRELSENEAKRKSLVSSIVSLREKIAHENSVANTPTKRSPSPKIKQKILSSNALQLQKSQTELIDLEIKIEQLKATIPNWEQRLQEDIIERETKKTDLSNTVLSILQLPSLLYAHPGSNAWNSLTNLAGRFLSLKLAIKKESTLEMALGAIAGIGTLSSLLEQTGIAHEDNPITDCAIMAAMVVHTVEFLFMAKNYIPTAKKSLSELSCFCFCSRKQQQN